MKIQKVAYAKNVLIFLLATLYNRKIVNRFQFINFNLLKKNTYYFNASFLRYLPGSLQVLIVDLSVVDFIMTLDLPCLFCIFNSYIYATLEFGEISGFVCFLDLLCISFLILLNSYIL